MSAMGILRQLCGASLCLFGLNTAHQLSATRVFPHVNTALVPFEAEATNLPVPQLFRGLPRPDFPTRPPLSEALDTHAVSPLSVAHLHAPQCRQGYNSGRVLSVMEMFHQSSSRISPLNKRHSFFGSPIGMSQRATRTIGMSMSRTRMICVSPFYSAHFERYRDFATTVGGTESHSIRIALRPDMKTPEYHVIWLSFRSRSHPEKLVWASLPL